MRIELHGVERDGPTARVSAGLVWEETDRPAETLVFETLERLAGDLVPGPEAFLPVGVLLALRDGERRVTLAADVCAELLEGLGAAVTLLRYWNPERGPVAIETGVGCTHPHGAEAGLLLSGGVDSLALLRVNHDRYDPGHPRRLTAGLVLRGIWRAAPYGAGAVAPRLERALADLDPIVADAGIGLVPVATNARDLAPDVPFFQYEYQGALMAAAAHAVANRFASVDVASTWRPSSPAPWGSHPLLDRHFGHHGLQVRHEMFMWSRIQKLRRLIDWDVAMDHLSVCNAEPEATGNCGRCEKCVRTLLALEALGALDRAGAFDRTTLRPADLDAVRMAAGPAEEWYTELVPQLRRQGRDDLVDAVDGLLARARRRRWRARLGHLDRRALGGSLKRLAVRLRPASADGRAEGRGPG